MDLMDNTWVNPANGLPMMDGCVEAMGNAYGMDSMSDSCSVTVARSQTESAPASCRR